MEIRSIVCSLLCSSHSVNSYFDRGLDELDLRWLSQNDGDGGFDRNTPDECIN